jgi:hypothetical protein
MEYDDSGGGGGAAEKRIFVDSAAGGRGKTMAAQAGAQMVMGLVKCGELYIQWNNM